MLSSQRPPLPPQQTFHRGHKLLPGVGADKAPLGGGMRDLGMDDDDDVEAYIGDRALRKPSRLEQMRADYQKMLLKKKEEKMVQVYEENQKKSMSRMARVGSGGGHTVPASPQGNVRDFFNERRRLAASGAPIPPIDNHYRQVKGHSSPAGWSSRTGSGSSVNTQKSSAGRDRAHPLAPIPRAQETGEALSHNNGRSGIPLRRQTNDQGDGNPFDVKPKMVKHQPLPARNNVLVDNNNNGGAKASALPRFNPGNRTLSQPNLAKSPQANRMPFPPAEDPAFRQGGQGSKLTEFQKWQLEQNKARENRLKKLNHRQQEDGADGDWRDPEEDPRFEDRCESGHDGEDESAPPNDKIKELEKQLLEKIAKEQSELKRIQMERKKEEEEDRKEVERQKKKEAAERARLKKLEEDRKKEEERRRKKEEEEDERLERAREEKQRLAEEQQRKGRVLKAEERAKLKTVDRRVKEEYIDDEEEEEEEGGRYTQFQPRPPEKVSSPAKRPDPRQTRSKASVHEREDPEAAPATDANYYLQAAASSEAKVSAGHLEKCSLCGRSFAPERLAKHETACRIASKPRKEFDSSKKRVEGTELAKYAGKGRRPEPPKKKSNWRAQHTNFIESLRYAKKVTQIEKEGGDLRQLAAPPRTIDPGLVPCPHCGRRFNETAAERHIPRCKDLKTRPPPMNTRRK